MYRASGVEMDRKDPEWPKITTMQDASEEVVRVVRVGETGDCPIVSDWRVPKEFGCGAWWRPRMAGIGK